MGPALVATALVVTACSSSDDDGSDAAAADEAPNTTAGAPEPTPRTSDGATVDAFGDELPPLTVEVPEGPLADEVIADLDLLAGSLTTQADRAAIERLGQSGDVRVAWFFSDLMRFFQQGSVSDSLVASFERLTGSEIAEQLAWQPATDRLIAWDVPAPPGYIDWKRIPFEVIEPAWAPFFEDDEADIDWRWVSWGGVLIDDRPVDETDEPCPRGCIPAINDPAVTDADGGDWYPDDRIVFGVVVDGEARAYPRNIMEVHEMVNDTLGGRRIGIPYCTLCGSAQAWFTDDTGADESPLELRTSGLLSRSNKVMYELNTFSVFDTFLGTAVSGPLREAGVQLEAVPVVTATWADWKEAHPDTTIVAEDGGLGRTYPLDPLRGRDDNGPIFPVGDVDARLGAQDQVVGVVGPEGPVAFDAEAARDVLEGGGTVELAGVRVVSDGAGLVAERLDGGQVPSHQAFWFAWSQFHPATELWVG